PVNVGANPYGFLAAFQAVGSRAEDLDEAVVRALATAVYRRQRPLAERLDRATAAVIVEMFCESGSFNTTRWRFPFLDLIPAHGWSSEDFARLRGAARENTQIRFANLTDGTGFPDAIETLIGSVEAQRRRLGL